MICAVFLRDRFQSAQIILGYQLHAYTYIISSEGVYVNTVCTRVCMLVYVLMGALRGERRAAFIRFSPRKSGIMIIKRRKHVLILFCCSLAPNAK
jgi:hypothetical protein